MVIEVPPAADGTVARLHLETQAFIADQEDAADFEEDFIEWVIVAKGGDAAFYKPGGGAKEDSTGRYARLYGSSHGRIEAGAGVKAAEHPYIIYEPLVADELEIEYRCNFLIDNAVPPNRCAITPNEIPDIMEVTNVILRQAGVKLVPQAGADLATNVFPTGTLMNAVVATDTSFEVAAADTMFCEHAKLKITEGATEAIVTVDYLVFHNTVHLTGPIGSAFTPAATVTWDVTPRDPTPAVPGCRELPDLPAEFVNLKAVTRPFASILNCRDGILNINFVIANPAGGGLAQQMFSPGTLYAAAADSTIVERAENGIEYAMVILLAPFRQPPVGPKDFISVLAYNGLASPVTARISSDVSHELMHGGALAHRCVTTGPLPDGVKMDEEIPVVLPVSGVEGDDNQNQMWHTRLAAPRIELDLDVMQAIVARGVSLLAPNTGALAVAPQDTPWYAGKNVANELKVAVTRGGAPVAGAGVEFYVKDTAGVVQLLNTTASTDAAGIAKVNVKGIGNAGDTARILAVAREGGDNASSSAEVTVVEVTNVLFTVEPLCVGSPTTSTASATVNPAGLPLEWSIEGADLGCSIDKNSGVITVGTSGGTITVRATHKKSSAFAEAPLKILDPSYSFADDGDVTVGETEENHWTITVTDHDGSPIPNYAMQVVSTSPADMVNASFHGGVSTTDANGQVQVDAEGVAAGIVLVTFSGTEACASATDYDVIIVEDPSFSFADDGDVTVGETEEDHWVITVTDDDDQPMQNFVMQLVSTDPADKVNVVFHDGVSTTDANGQVHVDAEGVVAGIVLVTFGGTGVYASATDIDFIIVEEP